MAKNSEETAETAPEPVAAAEPEQVTEQLVAPEQVAATELVAVPAQVRAAEAASSVSVTGPTAGVEQNQSKEYVTMAIKTAEDLVAFSQGNLEAVVKSGQIWAAGVQDLSKSFAATAQAQVEEALATVKALGGVKSLKEAVDLQTTLARSSLEKVVAETSKLTDASVKLAEQAMAPLTARVTFAVEKFGRAA